MNLLYILIYLSNNLVCDSFAKPGTNFFKNLITGYWIDFSLIQLPSDI